MKSGAQRGRQFGKYVKQQRAKFRRSENGRERNRKVAVSWLITKLVLAERTETYRTCGQGPSELDQEKSRLPFPSKPGATFVISDTFLVM